MTENEAIIREKISDFEMHYAEFDKYPNNIESDFVEALQSMLQEIQQYRAIGTVEEFKALKEKNEPKKIKGKRFVEAICPRCESELFDTYWAFGGIHYCSNCGQTIDWQ